MATKLPEDLLTRPAAQSARLIALALLDDAGEALERLRQGDDNEALHDFRVAIRRLRSTLRAYKTLLRGSVRKKHRSLLRDLARATNTGRDAEVQLGWLRGQADHLTARERTGLRWLEARLEARVQEEYAEVDSGVRREFAKVSQRLRRRLAVYEQEVRADGAQPLTLAAAAAAELRRNAVELSNTLDGITTPDDAETVHTARLAAKRVRYLLEPIAPYLAEAALVRRLKGVQDRFGELADSHQFEQTLAAALGEAASERARLTLEEALAPETGATATPAKRGGDPRGGIVAVAKLVRARRNAAFARISDWLGPGSGAAEVTKALEGAADRLAGAPATPSPSEGEPEVNARRRWRAKDRAR